MLPMVVNPVMILINLFCVDDSFLRVSASASELARTRADMPGTRYRPAAEGALSLFAYSASRCAFYCSSCRRLTAEPLFFVLCCFFACCVYCGIRLSPDTTVSRATRGSAARFLRGCLVEQVSRCSTAACPRWLLTGKVTVVSPVFSYNRRSDNE